MPVRRVGDGVDGDRLDRTTAGEAPAGPGAKILLGPTPVGLLDMGVNGVDASGTPPDGSLRERRHQRAQATRRESSTKSVEPQSGSSWWRNDGAPLGFGCPRRWPRRRPGGRPAMQEPPVGLVGPADVTRASPTGRPQGVEAPVVTHAGVGIGLDHVACRRGEPRPTVEEGRIGRHDLGQGLPAARRTGNRMAASNPARAGVGAAGRMVSGGPVVNGTDGSLGMTCIVARR